MRSCCSWHKTSLGCTGSPVGVLHQSQGQTGHARCAATALGFPVPMPFVQEPFFFFFCFLVDTASTGLLWWFCSCPWPSQFLLWFTALFWLSGMDVVVDLLPMLVPVLMSCFFPQSGTCHFSSTKEMLHPESTQSKCLVLNETFLCSSVMV